MSRYLRISTSEQNQIPNTVPMWANTAPYASRARRTVTAPISGPLGFIAELKEQTFSTQTIYHGPKFSSTYLDLEVNVIEHFYYDIFPSLFPGYCLTWFDL